MLNWSRPGEQQEPTVPNESSDVEQQALRAVFDVKRALKFALSM